MLPCLQTTFYCGQDINMFVLWLFAGSLLGLLAKYKLSRVGRRPAGCPPGPPTLPILGNLHLMPAKDGYLQFQKWAQEYG